MALINHRGFILPKDLIGDDTVNKIKNDLEVYPEITFENFIVKSFKVFKETKKFLILPLFYALNNVKMISDVGFKKPEILDNLKKCSIKLRDDQIECFEKCSDEKNKEFGGGIINLQTGKGKCLAKDTLVVMYSGALKKVQNVKVGDLLMGDNGRPRKVLSLARGCEQMYRVTPVEKTVYDISYTVNESHILSLKNDIKCKIVGKYHVVTWYSSDDFTLQHKFCMNEEEAEYFIKNTLVNNMIIDIPIKLYLDLSMNLQGYRVAVDFPHTFTLMNPYFFGKKNKLTLHKIPKIFKINSIEIRLQYLAGLIDSGVPYALYYIIPCNLKSFQDLIFIVYSLGLSAQVYLIDDQYYVQLTGGELLEKIPVRDISRRKTNVKMDYEIHIEKLGIDEYFGFEIDGNRRFLLKDFSVTHNTVVSVKLISHFSYKTLIVVNKIELLEQWKKEINKFIPDAKIGLIQGPTFKYLGCDIVIGMLQTISMKEHLTSESFSWVNLCIIDETHNIASEVFSKIMFKIRPQYLFGLSATVERKDKMEKVIKWYMGDVLYSDKGNYSKQSSEIHIYKYFGKSSVEKTLKYGTVAVAQMLTNISEDMERNNMIIKILKNLSKNKDRMILVISDRVAQLKYINKKLGDEISGLFIGSLKAENLENSKTKQILLGTYGMVSEGFNHPKLNTLLFATPRSSITQAIGRIYRKNHLISPVIVDIFDDFSIFKPQFYKRRKIYKDNINSCMFLTKNRDNIGESVGENSATDDRKLTNYCFLDD